MAKNEDENYLNGSKSIGATFPDWVFQTLSPQKQRRKKESDHLWSSTGAEEQSEESAPGPPAARQGGEKRNLQFS